MKTERFSLASATDVAVLDALVKVIRYDEGNAGGLTPTIKVKSISGGAYEVELKPGRQITLAEVTRGVVISNLSGGPLYGKITIGAGRIEDNSVVGSVEVIDGGRTRTIASMAFAWANGSTAGPATYAACQLWNPAGSGRRAIVKSLRATAIAAGQISIHTSAVALTTLAAALTNSKYPSGAAPVAQSRVQNLAAPTANQRVVDYIRFAAAGTVKIDLNEPIVIEPGYGVQFESEIVNTTVNGSYEWTEETL